MNIEEIEKFLDHKMPAETSMVKISFKKRNAVYGLFVRDKDYLHLKSKNFWRIVPKSSFDQYKESRNPNLAKIFSGTDFSRLTAYEDCFE
jgi:hypothetical protein